MAYDYGGNQGLGEEAEFADTSGFQTDFFQTEENRELPTQGGVTTIVRQQSGDQLLVSACGRTCSVDMHHTRSIQDLQAALQHKLQMEGQSFHICDINGQLLSTDMQVSDAISQGLTPLCATLPDKSLHHLENRREELAQMQWKLVRDQMNGSNNQVTQLTRQFNELTFQVQANHREQSNTIERFRQDKMKMFERERIAVKAEIQPLQEAINGAVLLINGERSKRELSVQGFEKHIHGVCDMLDGERASRRQDLAMHMSVMQELRASLDAERNSRTELEEVVNEQKRSTAKFQDEMRGTLRDQAEKLSRLQSDVGVSVSDIMARFTELEDRLGSLEGSMSEITSWTTGSLDRMTERHERVSQSVETMRLSNKHYEGSIANNLERTNELENLVRQYDGETRDQLSKEKQVRDDQVRRAQLAFTNESLKQITELEKRLTIRLERESAEREKNFQTMIDEVSKICEDRKLFRDQTFTKTVREAVPGVSGSQSARVMQGEPGTPNQNDSYRPTYAASEVTIAEGAHEKAQPYSFVRTAPAISPLMTKPLSPNVAYLDRSRAGSVEQRTGSSASVPASPKYGTATMTMTQSVPAYTRAGSSEPNSQPGSMRARVGSAQYMSGTGYAMAPQAMSPQAEGGAVPMNFGTMTARSPVAATMPASFPRVIQ